MTDHEIDQLSRMTWTHEELVEAGILPLTQRETAEYCRLAGIVGGKNQNSIFLTTQSVQAKLRDSRELAMALDDYQSLLTPGSLRHERRRRISTKR